MMLHNWVLTQIYTCIRITCVVKFLCNQRTNTGICSSMMRHGNARFSCLQVLKGCLTLFRDEIVCVLKNITEMFNISPGLHN